MTPTVQDRAARAVQWLVDNAAEIAAAKAEAEKAAHMLKVTTSLAIKASEERTAAAKEADAYASDPYRTAVEDLFRATKASEELKATAAAADATLRYWQSLNANQRAAERGYGTAR